MSQRCTCESLSQGLTLFPQGEACMSQVSNHQPCASQNSWWFSPCVLPTIVPTILVCESEKLTLKKAREIRRREDLATAVHPPADQQHLGCQEVLDHLDLLVNPAHTQFKKSISVRNRYINLYLNNWRLLSSSPTFPPGEPLLPSGPCTAQTACLIHTVIFTVR